jgi:hypothetical protein
LFHHPMTARASRQVGALAFFALLCFAPSQAALLQGCVRVPAKAPSGAGGGSVAGTAGGGGAGGALDAGGNAGWAQEGGAAGESPDAPVPTSPVIDCNAEPERCALCSGNYTSIPLNLTAAIRGGWQYNPGGPYVDLPVSGYPCAAFLYDGDVQPKPDDNHWVAAPNGESIGFSMLSSMLESGYRKAQFRYFRTLVFIPSTVAVDSFQVAAQGVDDSLHIVLYNSKHPDGVSPTDAGPSDPTVGACAGNGASTWDFKSYILPGEVNVVLIVHADMSPTISSLQSVEITLNGAAIPLFDCSR